MAVKKTNMVRLGVFVMAGLGFLILLLYVIGKNQNLFGSTFLLKVRFENVHGLMPGNNIRFAGIDAGSVKHIAVRNDTTIEVELIIKTKMKPFIRRNAHISIGTDGLIGNRVINIEPAKEPAPLVTEGEVLRGTKGADADEMLRVLNNTTSDVAAIASELRQTILRINSSKALWGLLEDERLPVGIRQSLTSVRSATGHLNAAMLDLSVMVDEVKQGKGTLGKLMRDSAIALSVEEAVDKIKQFGTTTDTLSRHLSTLVQSLGDDLAGGKGTISTLLKDEAMAKSLNNTIRNIEQDTRSLHEVLEALKQSFLLRGYFKKREKQKQENTTMPRY